MALGSDIADEARDDLNDSDSGNRRWSDAKMLRYINASVRQIVLMLPQAYTVETTMTPAAGIRQTIPSGGVKFLGVFNSASGTRGTALTQVELDALASSFPEWPVPGAYDANMDYPTTADKYATSLFDHFAHDPRQPKVFFLSPPQASATGQVLVCYSAIPAAMTALADTFTLADEFINPSVEYTKYRMLATDGRFKTSPEQRMELWNSFRLSLGLKPEAERAVDPGKSRAGGDDNG